MAPQWVLGEGVLWGWTEKIPSSGMCLPSKSGSRLGGTEPQEGGSRSPGEQQGNHGPGPDLVPISLGPAQSLQLCKPVSSPAPRQAAFGLGSEGVHLGHWSQAVRERGHPKLS